MRTMLKNTLKLLLAASFLLAVGWAVILFNGSPAEPVKPAQADIAMLNFGPKTQQQRFVEGLKELGMEEPRSYDWNGNKVFFSMMHTKDTPQQVMKKAHAIFKDKGLNKRSKAMLPPDVENILKEHMETGKISDPDAARQDIDEALASYDDFFSGGLIPMVNEPDYILMTGGTGHGDNITDAVSYLKARSKNQKNMIDQVKSMQVLEATRNPGADVSLVTAVWSDNELDMKRFMNQGEGIAADPDFPACPGCERLMSFGGETGNERGYISTSFVGSAPKDAMINFYDRSLGARGWRRMDASIMLDKLSQRSDVPMKPPAGFVGYARDDRFLTVDVSTDRGATFVQLMQTR